MLGNESCKLKCPGYTGCLLFRAFRVALTFIGTRMFIPACEVKVP